MGDIRSGLLGGLIAAGGPDTLEDLDDELGPNARAETAEQAAAAGDVVVVTIPLKHYRRVPHRRTSRSTTTTSATSPPLAEGWRIQRDTAAMYAADPADWWSKEPGTADVEKVAAAAASAKRYRDT